MFSGKKKIKKANLRKQCDQKKNKSKKYSIDQTQIFDRKGTLLKNKKTAYRK